MTGPCSCVAPGRRSSSLTGLRHGQSLLGGPAGMLEFGRDPKLSSVRRSGAGQVDDLTVGGYLRAASGELSGAVVSVTGVRPGRDEDVVVHHVID
ncbi:hypothetical protein BKA19_3182 [Blastococcus saxobsidens]|uniref:Uncharacterized protein n=1 Tax=Blastococcus saxobsidens TaxID=138336 RepID=A0A4Q7YA74_9ACTN|nr:hypothetical protein BKA19_3182 [Blastococcus saxobsidens]